MNRISGEHSALLERIDDNDDYKIRFDAICLDVELSEKQIIEHEERQKNELEILAMKHKDDCQLLECITRTLRDEISITAQVNSENDLLSTQRYQALVDQTNSELSLLNLKLQGSEECIVIPEDDRMVEMKEEMSDLVSSLLRLEKCKEDDRIELDHHIQQLVDELQEKDDVLKTVMNEIEQGKVELSTYIIEKESISNLEQQVLKLNQNLIEKNQEILEMKSYISNIVPIDPPIGYNTNSPIKLPSSNNDSTTAITASLSSLNSSDTAPIPISNIKSTKLIPSSTDIPFGIHMCMEMNMFVSIFVLMPFFLLIFIFKYTYANM